MKEGTVSLIGRPSSGKSTLINTICEMKVSIVSPVPQTTRNKIRGIYTDERGQLIFTDTPGYHLSEKAINLRMQELTLSALSDSDILLYLIDGTRAPGIEEERISNLVRESKFPHVIAINKIDIASDIELKVAEDFVEERFPREKALLVSARLDEGIDELLIDLFALAKEGNLLYDRETYTDQSLEFRIAEIIREKAMEGLQDELPHVIFVDVEDLEYNAGRKIVWIRAFINVERDGQKGFIVGKGGSNIKRIGTEAREDLKAIFPGLSVRLDLMVKVADKWRSDENTLNRIFR